VADVVMPGIGGRELAERLVVACPGVRMLFLSGYTDAVVRHGLPGSDLNFLQKPFSAGDLTRKVRKVLDAPHPS
jgi:two-component system, cell cycle sensor histidine kinase and response regulator CckA